MPALKETSKFDELIKKTGLQEVEVMRALQWMQNKKLIRMNQQLQEQIELDENGIRYKKKGLPERIFLSLVKEKTTLSQIEKS